jgi:hypothetical protein
MRISGIGRLTPSSRPTMVWGMRGLGQTPSCGPGLVLSTRNVAGGVPPGMTCGPVSGGEAECCCGDPSSPTYNAYLDPCSYVNTNQSLLAAQAAANTPAAIAANTGNNQTAIDLAQYPQNIQTDAYACYSSPGKSFTDDFGVKINCPSSSVMTPAGPTSAYTVEQLAQTLYASTPTVNVASNTGVAKVTNPISGNALNNTAPSPASVTGTPAQSNALVTGAGQTSPNTPSQAQIIAGNNVAGNTSMTNTSTSPISDTTTDDAVNWLESNWVLLAAGLAAVIILPGLLSHR